MKRSILNKVIKFMAKNQNEKHKMNAGQLREAVTLLVRAIIELEPYELEIFTKESHKIAIKKKIKW